MPKIDMKWELSPQFFVSLLNFVAILATMIYAYGSLNSDVRAHASEIATIKAEFSELRRTEITKLQAQDTATLDVVRTNNQSVAVRLTTLEVDVRYIKEAIARVEQRVTPTRAN